MEKTRYSIYKCKQCHEVINEYDGVTAIGMHKCEENIYGILSHIGFYYPPEIKKKMVDTDFG